MKFYFCVYSKLIDILHVSINHGAKRVRFSLEDIISPVSFNTATVQDENLNFVPQLNIRTVSSYEIDSTLNFLRILKRRNEDIRSFTKYDHGEKDFIIDLDAYIKVKWQLENLEFWYETRNEFLFDQRYPDLSLLSNYDRNITKYLKQLSLTVGGIKAAWAWLLLHGNEGFNVPSKIQLLPGLFKPLRFRELMFHTIRKGKGMF